MVLDIYFEENYGKLYEKAENGIAEVYKYSCDHGTIINQFIKREIPINTGSVKYYDIVTPYGFGGPIILSCDDENRSALVQQYDEAFSQYCKDSHIVSEFIRFHPIINNAEDFKSVYKVEYMRKTVGTNLSDYDDPVQSEFSPDRRRSIRNTIKKGVIYKVTPCPDRIDNFKDIYYSTMDRNNASEYYYFDDGYFAKCLEYFKANILLIEAIYEEKVVAAAFCFTSNSIIHIHLAGTLCEYLFLSPAYVLNYAITLWGKENGYKLIHHGGGRSNAEDDRLYLFKKQFGKNTGFDFYIGKKIWDESRYRKLCSQVDKSIDSDFFPAYRNSNI